MPKFMCMHTLPPNAITRQQAEQVAQAAQRDPIVHGYRSFLNLSEGKIVCVFDAPDRDAMARWFEKMNLPYDNITQVEFEGDRGLIHKTEAEPIVAHA